MSLVTLTNDISRVIKNKMSKRDVVKTGLVVGRSVLVDGRYYAYDTAVDIDVEEGGQVYVLLTEDRAKAVVVGR